MVVIRRQRGVNLRQRKMRMILLNCFGTPTLAEMVEHDLQNLDVGVVNPRATAFVEAYVRVLFHRLHGGANLRLGRGGDKCHAVGNLCNKRPPRVALLM